MNKHIVIYTDGMCNFNKTNSNNVGAYGYVAINGKGVKMFDFVGTEKNTTNNRMELSAVIAALTNFQCHTDYNILICSDSEYVIKKLTEKYYVKWIEKQWMIKNNPVKNRDLWEKAISLLHSQFSFKWIKAHSKQNIWNEYIDKLLRQKINK